jgi:hypothetical protein
MVQYLMEECGSSIADVTNIGNTVWDGLAGGLRDIDLDHDEYDAS